MIKINLSVAKKGQFDLSNVGGLDFTQAKMGLVIVAFVLLYTPELFLNDFWIQERSTIESEVATLNQRKATLSGKLDEMKQIEKEIEDLKALEIKLQERLTTVKGLISAKRNPSPLLVFVAQNTPKNLWINELVIDENNKMIVKGESIDYSSIGEFMNNMKASVFIRDSKIVKSETVATTDKKRLEAFELEFSISRFDQ